MFDLRLRLQTSRSLKCLLFLSIQESCLVFHKFLSLPGMVDAENIQKPMKRVVRGDYGSL